MTSLPRPIDAYTWTFTPSPTPLQFLWRTNFGLQGEMAFWETAGWLTVTSPCCDAQVIVSPDPGLHQPQWRCKHCDQSWLELAHLWAVENLPPFFYLNGGPVVNDCIVPWVVSLLGAVGADPLTSEVVASRFKDGVQLLSSTYLPLASAHAQQVQRAMAEMTPDGALEAELTAYELAAQRQVWSRLRPEMESLCARVNELVP